MDRSRMTDNLLELCSVPSISGTESEIRIAERIRKMLLQIDYFRDNPENVVTHGVPRDAIGRTYVSAFMEGGSRTSKTLILLSHFDVVGVEEFGKLKEYAFNPVVYTDHLKKSAVSLPKEARADLESGDYLFGRGIMDMKYGIAADVEILHQIGRIRENFPGNILFLSVPDEEANSAGMLAAVEMLYSLRQTKQLDYIGCIVSEPHFPKYPGDSSKYIYTGAVGKLLPVFYCVGRETHVGEPFSGINPNLLSARIIQLIEQNPELSDCAGDFHVPTPVCLKHSDTKEDYSVQTPTAAYAYFNFMTVRSSPEEVLGKLKGVAREAFVSVLQDVAAKAKALERKTGSKPALPVIEPVVMTFEELFNLCRESQGKAFEAHMTDFIASCQTADLRQASLRIIREVHQFCPYRDPMIILSFAPPYYPHSEALQDDSKVMQVCRQLIRSAKEQYGETLSLEPYFPGLSDMSYLSVPAGTDLKRLKNNFPLWGSRYAIPLDLIAQLGIPFMNIGPLGKDAHKYVERLCLSYSFDVAAKLLYQAVLSFFDIDMA